MKRIDKYFADVIGINKDTKFIEEVIDAKDLIVSNRIDLIAKVKYIESLDKQYNTNFFKDLYKETLNCFTEGTYREPGNKNKNSFDDYVTSFNKMIKDIKKNGFDDKKSIIPVSRDNVIYDGAHRVAICAYYNKKITIARFKKDSINYDLDYFKNKFLNQMYLDYLCLEYCKLKDNINIFCIWPVCGNKNQKDIIKYIKENTKVLYEKDILFTYNGLNNFMIDVYKDEKWIGNINNKFKGIKTKLNNCYGKGFTKFIIVCEDDTKKLVNIKNEIRKRMGISNHSVHSTDSTIEVRNLLNIILNKNTIDFYNKANIYKYKNIHKKLNELKIKDNILIDGSSILELYGLRESNDIDVVTSNEINGIDNHNKEVYMYDKTIDDLLYDPSNYIYFNGFKFISLELLKIKKIKRGEKKNLRDVELINSVLVKDNLFKSSYYIVKRSIYKFVFKIRFYLIKFLELIGLYQVLRKLKRKIIKER